MERAKLKSYRVIVENIQDCQSLEDQRLFIESLIYQCALLARMTAGDTEFQSLLSRLRHMSFDELEAATMLEISEGAGQWIKKLSN